jgi:hypothetical protein
MGETPGYLVDPKSAKAVLNVLMKVTNIKVSLSALEKKSIRWMNRPFSVTIPSLTAPREASWVIFKVALPPPEAGKR